MIRISVNLLPNLISLSLLLIWLVFRHLDGYLIIRLRNILFKINTSFRHFQPAADIFQAESDSAFIQLVKISLDEPASVMMDTKIKFITMYVLRQVNKTGTAVF